MKNRLSRIAACALLAGLLLGSFATAAFAEQVNPTFWFYLAGPNFDKVKAVVDEFNAAHPHIHVDVALETSWEEDPDGDRRRRAAERRADALDLRVDITLTWEYSSTCSNSWSGTAR